MRSFLAWVILFATVPIIGTRLTLLHTSPANTRPFYNKATEEMGTGQALVATATKINSPIDIQRVIFVQDGDSGSTIVDGPSAEPTREAVQIQHVMRGRYGTIGAGLIAH